MEDLLIVKDMYEPIGRSKIPKGVLESDWKGHDDYLTMCRCKCPSACGERHECPRNVAEAVGSV